MIIQNVFSQSKKIEKEVKIVSHTVALGETIRMISRKYLVEPSEIYKLNKHAVDGVSSGMVLLIPVPIKDIPDLVSKTEINNEDLEIKTTEITNSSKENSEGQTISTSMVTEKVRIKKPKSNPELQSVSGESITHIVKPGETLFMLSRQYSISVNDLKNANLQLLKNGLKTGQNLKIPNQSPIVQTKNEVTNQPSKTNEGFVNNDLVTNVESEIEHKVQPKETLFSLAKKYNISVEELQNQNQEVLKRGLQVGQTLKIKKNN